MSSARVVRCWVKSVSYTHLDVYKRQLLQPLTVRKKSDGRYELIAGERRLRACILAGINAVSYTHLDVYKRQTTAKAASTKSVISALEGIHLSLTGNQLTVTGYDLELGLSLIHI